jgi:hypothetical protein
MNYKIPVPNYLDFLTDDFGTWQHANDKEIIKEEGYALDDSSRSLIVFILLKKFDKAKVCLNYIEKSFKNGLFVGFFDGDRNVKIYPSSFDAAGLVYWSLAFAVKKDFEKEKCLNILSNIDLNFIIKQPHIRSKCYLLIGASLLKNKILCDNLAEEIISNFSIKNKNLFTSESDIYWFEDKLTYANAILPYSLLIYLEEFVHDKNLTDKINKVVFNSLDTLERYMRVGIIPCPIGNREWQPINRITQDIYGQQPIDAGFMVIFLEKLYRIYENEIFLNKIIDWYSWFWGNNIFKESLVRNIDFACADGIDLIGIKKHYGAESVIVFLWATILFKKLNI